MRFLQVIGGVVLSIWLAIAPVYAGSLTLLGAGKAGAAAPAYAGPGDIVSGATVWGSCARVYQASLASTATSLCDLKDVTTGTVSICTLRGSSTGFVDLTGSYCVGSTTPAVACAAAAGGSCIVSKIYNQTNPGTNDLTQASASSMMPIVFNDVNGLPSIGCGSGGVVFTATSGTFTTTNFSLSVATNRTGSFTTAASSFGGNGAAYLGHGGATNTVAIYNLSSVVTQAGNDSTWHGLQGTFSSTAASDALNVDGSDFTSLSAGTGGLSAVTLRTCRANGQLQGKLLEIGFWPTTSFNATQRGNLYGNMHGTSGYNGAF